MKIIITTLIAIVIVKIIYMAFDQWVKTRKH